jgi:hypothetical protein
MAFLFWVILVITITGLVLINKYINMIVAEAVFFFQVQPRVIGGFFLLYHGVNRRGFSGRQVVQIF